VLGRFLSADPLVIAPGDPQMLDRYSYVRNNPLRYVDPTGLGFEELTPSQWADLTAAGRTLGSWGIPESQWANTLILIAGLQKGGLTPNKVVYIGSNDAAYSGSEIMVDRETGGAAAMATYGDWTGTYGAAVLVMLPKTEAEVGYVIIMYAYEPADAPLSVDDVTVNFSSGDDVLATHSESDSQHYKSEHPSVASNHSCEVYTFGYSDSYGYPTSVGFAVYPSGFQFSMSGGTDLTVSLVPWSGNYSYYLPIRYTKSVGGRDVIDWWK
jgi:hypothetical protein